jgi:hypothetical protein
VPCYLGTTDSKQRPVPGQRVTNKIQRAASPFGRAPRVVHSNRLNRLRRLPHFDRLSRSARHNSTPAPARPAHRVPTAPSGVGVPDVISPSPSTVEGADVQEAELVIGSTVSSGRVAMQSNPPLSISCYSLGVGSPEERCTIGPLKKGQSWTITLVYSSPVPPGHTFPDTIGYWATIDGRNKIAERREDNNAAGITVSFQ